MTLRLTRPAPRGPSTFERLHELVSPRGGGRLTVLDAGLAGDWRHFCSALSRLGHAPDDVDAVLVTHHHPDHAGNAERLRAAGARVLSHPADASYLRGEKQLDNSGIVRYLWRPWYAAYMLRYLAKGITRTPAVARLDELADGEVLDVPGFPRVVHAPGHTAGSCALFLEDRSLLFSGDALVTLDLERGPRGRPGPQVVRGPHTEDADLALASLDVLAATNAETVLPGHGEPWPHGTKSAVNIARAASPGLAGLWRPECGSRYATSASMPAPARIEGRPQDEIRRANGPARLID